MTTIWSSQCNQCGNRLVGEDRDEFFDRGWIEVWKLDDGPPLEFCDQECLVNYFRREEEA